MRGLYSNWLTTDVKHMKRRPREWNRWVVAILMVLVVILFMGLNIGAIKGP